MLSPALSRLTFRRVAGVLALATVVACAAVSSARADLAGNPGTPPALTQADADVLAANPDLAGLEEANPWTLRVVLSTIAAARAGQLPSTNSTKGVLDATDSALVARNPGLRDVYRGAPDAAVDLLALIRAAGGKGKPK
jgi:hypothetical protein